MIKRTLLFEKKASLTTQHKQLVIKTEEREVSVPIEDIGFVVIEHPETYLSIPAMNRLVANNAAVIVCDEKHMPSGMFLNLEGHHLQQALFAKQIEASEPLKKTTVAADCERKDSEPGVASGAIGEAERPVAVFCRAGVERGF